MRVLRPSVDQLEELVVASQKTVSPESDARLTPEQRHVLVMWDLISPLVLEAAAACCDLEKVSWENSARGALPDDSAWRTEALNRAQVAANCGASIRARKVGGR